MSGGRRERAWGGELRWTVLHTAAAAWTAGGLLLAYLDPWLWDALWVMNMAVWSAYVLTGAILAFAWLVTGVWGGWTRGRVTALGALLLGALLVSQTSGDIRVAAHQRRFQARFRQMAPHYERIVKELAPRREVPRLGSSGSVGFQVDAGPPHRIAFPQPGGIVDNWAGVIHDPSRALDRAIRPRDAPGEFTVPPDLAGLFGGTLLGCRAIRDHFYQCWFT